MADDLRNVQSGDPLKIPASAWNTMVAAARKFRANGNGFSGSGVIEGLSSDPALTTVVRNDTLSAFTAGGPCGLSESLVSPILYEHEARARTALSAIAPENGKAFGIALGPIPADGFGTVAIHGLTIAWVLLTDPADQYAGITDDGDTTHFVSNATRGPVRILWVPEDAVADDLVAAVVMFHGFGWPTRLGTAAGDELLLPVVTKVCFSGVPDTVAHGYFGYPLDDTEDNGALAESDDIANAFGLTVERRVVTFPGDTEIGPPVCIVAADDCCITDPPDPEPYPPGDDPPGAVLVPCCGTTPISIALDATLEWLSGGYSCLDGAVIPIDWYTGGAGYPSGWSGTSAPVACGAYDQSPGSCSLTATASMWCITTAFQLVLSVDGGYRTLVPAPASALVCDPLSITFNSVALQDVDGLTVVTGCDIPAAPGGAPTFRVVVTPRA